MDAEETGSNEDRLDEFSDSDSEFEIDEDDSSVDDEQPLVRTIDLNELNDMIYNAYSDEDLEDSASTTETDTVRNVTEWGKDFPFCPISTPFTINGTGPNSSKFSSESSASEILAEYLTDDMLKNVLLHTEDFVRVVSANKPTAFRHWKSLSLTEFRQFVGLNVLMGVVKKPSIKTYWSTNPLLSTPIFSATMCRQRFEDILRGLHFCDNATCDFTDNRMLKLGSFLPDLIKRFKSNVVLGEYLCIDESLLLFKGRLSFRQYIPSKRARYGIKFFILVGCSTKTVHDILPYQGKKTKYADVGTIIDLGISGLTTLTLLKEHYGKNHKVVVDNWFSSPALATVLRSNSTGLLGTVRRNRKQMPKFGTKLQRGDVEQYSNGNLLVERWLDRREVLILNTFQQHSMALSEGRSSNAQKLKPATVLTYNKYMGGVDDIDKITKPYASERKTVKWYKKVFFYLIDIAIYNSYLVYCKTRGEKHFPYMKFLLELVHELIDKPTHREPRGRKCIDTMVNSRISTKHIPEQVLKNGRSYSLRCSYCSRRGSRHDTSWRCRTCEVRLCMVAHYPEHPGKNCFELWHTEKKLPNSGSTKRSKFGFCFRNFKPQKITRLKEILWAFQNELENYSSLRNVEMAVQKQSSKREILPRGTRKKSRRRSKF